MKSAIVKAVSVLVALGLIIVVGIGERASAQQAEKKDEAVKKDAKEQAEDEVTGWRIRDFTPYIKAIQELEKLNKEYSENLLKLAIDEYSTGLDILEDMENEIIKMKNKSKNKKYLNERFHWQEIDRKNAEARQVAAKKYEAKMKSVTYFTRAINYLDQIQSNEVRQEGKFLNFQLLLFKVYVSTQYDLQNFKPCIPILERYIAMNEQTKKDMWAYRYMASCYGYMEKVLTRYHGATEDEINQWRNKKNRSLLQAVELKYGIDSPHYKNMQEIVEQDEKRSEKINDFK